MIFFGPPRFLLVVFVLLFLAPVLLYQPLFAVLIGGLVVLMVAGGALGRPRVLEAPPEPARLPRAVQPPQRFAEVARAAQDDLLSLAEDIRALDLDIEMPGVAPEAKRDYERALNAYDRAKQALDAAVAPEELEAVSEAVEEGRYALASAHARLEGRRPPERRPPCFFDPRHGPSVRDVEWAPPGGAVRPVPACAADAIRIEEGDEPSSREVLVGGRPVPYWEAPAYYGPWAGGFFSASGVLLPTLLLGSALGVGLSPFDPFGDGVDER